VPSENEIDDSAPSGTSELPGADNGSLDDLIREADERLGESRRDRRHPEVAMFASKFELPEHFGARVSAIYDHLTEAQSIENNQARREALRKGLIESCRLLRDIDMGAVSYELEAILRDSPSLKEIPLPPGELEPFLKLERELLTEVNVSGAAIEDIDRLLRQLTNEPPQLIQPDNMVDRFYRLQEEVCSRSKDASTESRRIGARSIWFGLAGASIVVLNAGAVPVAPPVAALSTAFGGGLIGRALK
jgi:hypothetical protein